jgi:formylglycine-generating enzyme required for sulfatase activity
MPSRMTVRTLQMSLLAAALLFATQSWAGILVSETFDTDVADRDAFSQTYPFSDFGHPFKALSPDAASAMADLRISVVNGVARMSGPSPTGIHYALIGGHPGDMTIGADIGGNQASTRYGFGIAVGQVRFGLGLANGGTFSVWSNESHTAISPAFPLGFAVAPGVLHHWTIDVEASTGTFDISIVDGTNPSNVFTTTWVDQASVGAKLGLFWQGASNADEDYAGLFDNIQVTTGYALRFDGINDIVSFQKWFTAPASQYSMAAWVRINGPGTGEGYNSPRMIAVHRGHQSNTIAMTYRESGVLKHDNITGDERDQKLEVPDSFLLGSWFNMAISFDGEWMRLYKDGEQIGEKLVPVDARAIDWETNYRGSLLGGEGGLWGGFGQVEVDEFSIWNVALSTTELRSAMNSGLTGDESGLLAYYTFEEGSGESVQDRSGHGRNGQLGTSSSSDDADPLWVVSTAPLSGQTASAPVIELSTAALGFGETVVGASGAATFAVRNTGDATLTVSDINSSDGQWTASASSFGVVPGSSQDVTVTFAPSAAGIQSGTLTIASNDPDEGTVTVSLSGDGVSPPPVPVPAIALSGSSLSFGDVLTGESGSQSLSITNDGSADLSITAITSSDVQFVPSMTAFVVTPGDTRDVDVLFTPSSLGIKSAALMVISNDPDQGTQTVSLSGNGVSPPPVPTPDIALSTGILSFGDVRTGESGSSSVSITNEGTADLSITGITSSDAQFVPSMTTFVVTPGSTQGVGVVFAPSNPGSKSGILTVTSNDSNEPAVTVALSGSGVEPDIDLTPSEILFGDVIVGESKQQSLVITNSGDAVLSVISVQPMAEEVTVAPASLSIQPGATDSVAVTYTPITPGDLAGFLRVSSNDPDESMLIVNLGGHGVAVQDPPGNVTVRAITETLPGGVTAEFIQIDPGTFLMGSPGSEPGRDDDESPQHYVTITKGFYLGKTEVTQGQWTGVMGTRPWSDKENVVDHPEHPAVWVTWDDVQEFIEKLNHVAGWMKYRLPTEAEWEYSCRAGTTTSWSFGSDESRLKDYAWYGGSAGEDRYAHRVGTKLPSPWGLHDIHGNVYEWVQGWKGSYPSEPQVNPVGGPPSGAGRAARDGYYGSAARYVRSANRMAGSSQSTASSALGFRLLRVSDTDTSATPPQPPSGEAGNALQFDGDGDFVSIAHSEAFNTPEATVEFWFRKMNDTIGLTPGLGYSEGLVSKRDGDAWPIYLVVTEQTSPFGVVVNVTQHDVGLTQDFPLAQTVVTSPLTPGTWYHVASVHTSSVIKVYLAGELVGSTALTGPRGSNLADILIGHTGFSNSPAMFLDGEIDEVRIWDVARTQEQIAADMSRVLTGTESGLVALYRFDLGAGTIALDSTPNGHHGILHGDPQFVPSTAPLSGADAAVPDLSLSSSALSFGEVQTTESGTLSVSVANDGTADLSITNVASSDAQFTPSMTAFVVTPGGTQDLNVVFTPSSAGSASAILTFTSNDPEKGTVTVVLTGTGVPPPIPAVSDIALSSSELSFGAVKTGQSASQSVAVSNTGGADLTVTEIRSSNAQFAVDTDSFTVPAGLSYTVQVTFTPSGEGELTGTLIVKSNDPAEGLMVVTLSGSGASAGEPPVVESLSIKPERAGAIASLMPTFYWTFSDGDGDGQSAWEIQVGSEPGVKDTDLWDSGRQEGQQRSAGYSGSALEWGTVYAVRIRVWDSSGMLSAWKQGIFETLDNQPPVVKIDSPEDGTVAVWDSTADLRFSATAQDGDESGVRIDSLSWGSSLDGILKTGTSSQDANFKVFVRDLSIGVHEITFRAWDNEGDSSSAEIGLTVKGLPPTARITSVRRNSDERFHPDTRKVDGLLTAHDFVFSGDGEDADEFGSEVVGYTWTIRSLSDGEERILSNESSFQVEGTDLGAGLQMVYLRVVDDEGEQSEPDSVKVILREGWGRAIIVAGGGHRGENYDTFVRSTWGVAQYVYNRLYMNRQFAHESIDYLAPTVVLADTTVQVDGVPNTSTLMQAIDGAQSDNVQLGIPLVIFLAGHGGEGVFLIDDNEELLAEELDSRLNAIVDAKVAARLLESTEAAPRDEIVLVVDVCYSSTFLEKIAGPGRVVVGSSSRTVASTLDGRSFGSFFFEEISKGRDVWRSFNEASDRLHTDFDQTPYLDADGDGVPVYDEAGGMNPGRDEEIARSVFIGGDYGTSSRINPEIYGRPTASPGSGGSGEYVLEVAADRGLLVGCLVIPEDSDLTSEGAVADVVRVTLEPSSTIADTSVYQAVHELPGSGRYVLVFQASDQLGNLAAQRTISLDHVALVGDFDGDGEVGFQDFIVFAKAYGTSSGDEGWVPQFDLNRDGVVEFQDFLIFAQAYGRSS